MSALPKPTVKYSKAVGRIAVGGRAFVFPIDHPDTTNVKNGEPAWTTEIVAVGESGQFETKRTVYILETAA